MIDMNTIGLIVSMTMVTILLLIILLISFYTASKPRTYIRGKLLDLLGAQINIRRRIFESDTDYRKRIKRTLRKVK